MSLIVCPDGKLKLAPSGKLAEGSGCCEDCGCCDPFPSAYLVERFDPSDPATVHSSITAVRQVSNYTISGVSGGEVCASYFGDYGTPDLCCLGNYTIHMAIYCRPGGSGELYAIEGSCGPFVASGFLPGVAGSTLGCFIFGFPVLRPTIGIYLPGACTSVSELTYTPSTSFRVTPIP